MTHPDYATSDNNVNTEDSKPAYYAVIPASVRYSKHLEPAAKLLYGEITALCNKEGYCWASNQYFADLYEVTDRVVKNWVKSLVDAGFITTQKFNVGFKTKRKIFLSQEFITKGKKIPPREDFPTGREENFPPEGEENFTQVLHPNNTSGGGVAREEPEKSESKVKNESTISKETRQSSAGRSEPQASQRLNAPPNGGGVSGECFLSNEMRIVDLKGKETVVTKNDLVRRALKTDWESHEMEEAWKIMRDYGGAISDWYKFIEGTIHRLRLTDETRYAKRHKKPKTKQPESTEPEKEKRRPSPELLEKMRNQYRG